MTLPKKDLDSLDREIIFELQEDARRSYKSIAAKLDVSESTVSNRVNRLVKSGILKLQARVDPFHLPNKVAAVIGLNLERREHAKAISQIERITEVTAVWNATGKYDLMCEVMVDSMDQLNKFLFDGGLDGVENVRFTESFIILASKTKYFKLH